MTGSARRRTRRFVAGVLATVVFAFPAQARAGEINLSTYIGPNQMSNLLTRHVRKGIIKRIGISDHQLIRIREAIDPHRDLLLLRITGLKEARIELMTAVASHPFDPDMIAENHAGSVAAELLGLDSRSAETPRCGAPVDRLENRRSRV